MSDTDKAAPPVNQCDGCQAGMPLRYRDLHTDEAGHAVMICQKDRYAAPPTEPLMLSDFIPHEHAEHGRGYFITVDTFNRLGGEFVSALKAAAPTARAPECVIVCQRSVDCGAWPDGACEQGCAQAERAQAGDGLPPLPEPAGVVVVNTQALRAFTADQMRAYALAARGAHAGDDDALTVAYMAGRYDGRKQAEPWIPVTERLPEEGTAVVAYVPGWHGAFVGHVDLDYDPPWMFDDEHLKDPAYQPTHWMPLPDAPGGLG